VFYSRLATGADVALKSLALT